jgi:adenosylmethionine-8-amino-7-oxononanoate aminotransferase
MPGRTDPLLVHSAAGVRLRLVDGAQLVDGMSSWWAAIHGYAHPVLDAAVRDQLGRMSHVMFGGLTHEPAIRLARRLVEITPEPLQHVFFADSGSVSVEVAIKMCLQYWRSLARPDKRRLLTWRGGYHGDTFGAMSVCDPDGGMHSLWSDLLARQVFVPRPPAQRGAAVRTQRGAAVRTQRGAAVQTQRGTAAEADLDPGYVQLLAETVARHADELAAVIVEPVVQGAGGMRFHDPRYLNVLRELTLAHDILLIFDEIATGFGRTGALFAAHHAGVSPDVMCVGKALTGGYLTMAAALCTSRVAEGISGGKVPVLAHGPTFMANPLAAAVSSASIDLLLGQDWQAEVRRLEAGLRAGLAPAAELPGVVEVRVLGAIGVVQLDRAVDLPAATAAAVSAGVWLRPFRDLVYTMPPYVTNDEELAQITQAVLAAVAAG